MSQATIEGLNQATERYEGLRTLTEGEIKIFEIVREVVLKYLESIGYVEGIKKLRSLDLNKIRIYRQKSILVNGEWTVIKVKGTYSPDDIMEFPESTLVSSEFFDIGTHEFFHYVTRGLAVLEVSKDEHLSGLKTRFPSLTEAITETLPRCLLPEGTIFAHDSINGIYRFILQVLIRKIVADKNILNRQNGLKEAWKIFQDDYFYGTSNFVYEIQRLYGAPMVKKLEDLGMDKDADIDTLKEIHTSSGDDFADEVVGMVFREINTASIELDILETELREVVMPQNP